MRFSYWKFFLLKKQLHWRKNINICVVWIFHYNYYYHHLILKFFSFSFLLHFFSVPFSFIKNGNCFPIAYTLFCSNYHCFSISLFVCLFVFFFWEENDISCKLLLRLFLFLFCYWNGCLMKKSQREKKKHKIQRDIINMTFYTGILCPPWNGADWEKKRKTNHPLGNKTNPNWLNCKYCTKNCLVGQCVRVCVGGHEKCPTHRHILPKVLRILLVFCLYIYTSNEDFSSLFFTIFFCHNFFFFNSKVNNFNSFSFNLHYYFSLITNYHNEF